MTRSEVYLDVAEQSVLALAFSGLFSRFGGLSFAFCAAVLLACWPLTYVGLLRIRSRNPSNADECAKLVRPRPARRIWPFFLLVGVSSPIALGISWLWHIRIAETLGWTVLALSGFASVQAIITEAEDNAPGGWENPR